MSPKKFHIPSDLVVNHWNSDVESSSHLDFLLLHVIWTLFGLLISYKITSIVSTSCDFTTKSGGVWAILEQFCLSRGLAVDEWISEIGGGLNFRRPKFLALIDRIVARHVSMLIIAHKDRLVRFGFDLIEHLARTHGCTVLVLNTETLSPEQEMV